jgi:GTP-binding protein EngB required for normal cell division
LWDENIPQNVKHGVTAAALLAAGLDYLYDLWKNRNAELDKKMKEMQQTMREYKLETFDDLMKHDKRKAEALVTLAKNVEPFEMQGQNIGFFGQTSTGKSTIINSLLGKEEAATGYGEVTVEPKRYKSEASGYILWDMPGKNDEVSYYTIDYIGFWKGLTRRMIVIQSSVKEMTAVTQLLDQVGLDYDIVVNKFNLAPQDERQKFREQIRREATQFLKNGVTKKIWFINGQNVKDAGQDWLQMVDSLTDRGKPINHEL